MEAGGGALLSVSYNLEPSQFLSGWREESGTLFVPTLSESRVGDEVAIRVGIFGHAIRATLCGKVSLVRRVGRPALPPGVELHLEKQSRAAAAFLAMAARGVPVSFKERAPRWAAHRNIRVTHRGIPLEVTTLNVSEGGCAVAWPGQRPLVGDEVSVRVKQGLFAPSLRAIVCWNQSGGEGEKSVGLKVVALGRGGRSWRSFVAEIARSGASAT
jgi:hypothetical protein